MNSPLRRFGMASTSRKYGRPAAIKGSVLNGGKLRLNKIEFLIGNCGNQALTAAMDITKSEENKHSLLRTKLDRSLVNIQNTHFDCIPKWLFLIDLHLN
jgi:hypothetical protein